MPKYQNQEQQAKKFLEGTYDTLYNLFSQYARRAYEEQRHGPKPKMIELEIGMEYIIQILRTYALTAVLKHES
ncbi:hypothetical protein GW537_00185 [Piscirickettsia salmonis]|uniref:hypothetical protein n=1 Tax=Piscirickettsia salmonis TaxID=1238 RepID=UPI00137BAE85|nr:hypothetical protein [Piscirickettsia salmonis]QHS27851.1 hypothetical protein GW537_00185 [Piscirickettsia salmonis]